MAPGLRRPPPDRESILSSIGLPPRQDIPTPASPTYDPGRPQGTRRSRAGSNARQRSERSYNQSYNPNGREPALPNGRYNANTDPDRRRQRDQRDYDRDYYDSSGRPYRTRHESISSRKADRSRTLDARRPAIPPAYSNDDFFAERERDRRPTRSAKADAPASLRAERSTYDRDRRIDSDRDRTRDRRPHRQLDRDPRDEVEREESGEDSDDLTPAGARGFSKVPASRRGANGRDLEPYEDAQEPAPRARSRSVPHDAAATRPSTYGREARGDDLLDHELRAGSKRRSVLSRVLSSSSFQRPSQAPPPSGRLTRYNTVKRTDASERGGARIDEVDPAEEERLAKEALGLVGGVRRSRVFDESHPQWLSGDVPSAKNEHESLGRATSKRTGSSRNSERQKTLESLERNRGAAILDAPKPAAPHDRSKKASAAAAAAATGVAIGAAAPSDPDSDSGSSVSSIDSELLEDAHEAPDVHDDDALSTIVLGTAAPAGAAPASLPAAIPEEDSSDGQSSSASSEEEDDDHEVDIKKPTTRDASTSDANGTARTATAAAAPALAGALAAAPAAASTNAHAASANAHGGEEVSEESESTESSSEEDSGTSTSASDEEDDPAAPAVAPTVSPASQSKARAAPAIVAGAGAAVVAGALAAGALNGRKSHESPNAAAQRKLAAEAEKERLRVEQAELEREAESQRLIAAKAARKDEKRKAKEAAAAAAAAAAIKDREAKKAEREQARNAKEREKLEAKEARRSAMERKEREKSEARDRAIREREDAEAKKLLAIREAERAKEERLEARRQSRRKPHGGRGPATRGESVRPLTPQQRHYLLKALVMLQMQSEWSELEKLGALTEYGYPFSSTRSKLARVKTFDKSEDGEFARSARDPYANDDTMRETEDLQEPLILRHLFHVHLHTFPGLDRAPEKYWQKRIQPFFDEMAARNFSSSLERGEISKRRLYSYALTRYLGSFFARGFGVRGEGELRGPGVGEPGSEKWGVGKQWGKGTVKRGLDKPIRIEPELLERIDNLFEGEGGRLWREAGKDWRKVRRDWCGFKESIIESETGLEEAISYLDISSIKNLPPHYKNSVEFARIHAAYIFHALFVAAPNADELYKMVKGIHALAPYWGAKQLLKYANAETMISGILSLLLARPGGAKSLLQRIFSYVVGKDASYIQKEFVAPIRKEIDDEELARKVEEYVRRGDRVEARRMRDTALKRGEDVLTTILLSPTEPRLGQQARDHVLELQRCFTLSPYRGDLGLAYPETTPLGADRPPVPSWGAQGAEHGRARKFALLKLLLRESLKRRDREQAVEFASGSLIPAIIKDSLESVFYPIIRTIAATANLSERLGDLQKFIDDLLDVKKRGDDHIEAWIALAARHEQALYFLFHECASIAKPLWDWCQLGLDYMALSTTDPANPADRSAPNLEVNFEELLQDARLTDADVKKVLIEIDRLAAFTKWSKVRYELEARKNYLLARPEAASPSGLCEAELPPDAAAGLRKELEDLDGMMRDLLEESGLELDDGNCADGVRGTEKYDFPWAFFAGMDPLNQHLPAEAEAGELRVAKVPTNVAPPTLKHTRKVLPLFCELLASRMPEWQSEDVLGSLGAQQQQRQSSSRLPSFGGKRKGPATTFDKETSFDERQKKLETRSVMSSASSRFRLPSLFGRK
ncbi:uncharacterized protein PFL1_03373 [Pseudozyma flocculosa PF-1]|uniref:DUF3818 domain-containing protein n=2 Tax=Pseudozyma flocculosa TaxID=84751 RepID=A0A5C3F6K9_9BASI|nr:uncharacterized protein PFL1_03373 [Pseudozyma flocculosa PF-1]EPQ29084.1 hypothetical protein PFL1_03373 [Pseudozyma flocculosa PF-1]SPO40078.1 uncharacterized protein PSFLO_05560 [Pseudozyma flocculosa]